MSSSPSPGATTSSVNDEIAQLREQVRRLMDEKVSPAIADAADKAQRAVHGARDMYQENTEALSARVREAPLAAILIAAGVGYLLGRVSR